VAGVSGRGSVEGEIMGQIPIVKYEGMLWYYDERLNELRDYYTAEPRRLDSSYVEKEYFSEMIVKKVKPLTIYDADADDDDYNHVPRSIRDELQKRKFEEMKEGLDEDTKPTV
jgi:hypothetical protein